MATHHTVKPQIESPDSSSPLVTRAVAAGLRGEFFDTYLIPEVQKIILQILGRFPQGIGRFIISRANALGSLDPSHLSDLNTHTLASERLRDYEGLDGRFKTITIGAALGGASAHIALALGGPFLPVAFVTTIRGGSTDGNINIYFNRGWKLAQEITRRNPDILAIQHYDPIHDEWLTRRINHLRLKLLRLPEIYMDYISTHLEPGGTLCYLNSQASWRRYRLGSRSIFQVGGWGDIPPDEYLNGSPRISAYCQRLGLESCYWRLSGFPLETGMESEWGCEPVLFESLESFCHDYGYQFLPISFPQPHDYSRLAFEAILYQLKVVGRQPAGVLVEMFSQFDSSAVRMSGLLPLWLVFNTNDCLSFLNEMSAKFPKDKPVFFSPLSTFTNTPDIVPWQQWEDALRQFDWYNIGTRPTHYPSDTLTLTTWANPLHKWVKDNFNPISSILTPDELIRISEKISRSGDK